MPVNCVLNYIYFPAAKPFIERFVRFVENALPLFVPLEFLRLFRPEAFTVFYRSFIKRIIIFNVRLTYHLVARIVNLRTFGSGFD